MLAAVAAATVATAGAVDPANRLTTPSQLKTPEHDTRYGQEAQGESSDIFFSATCLRSGAGVVRFCFHIFLGSGVLDGREVPRGYLGGGEAEWEMALAL